MPIVIALLVVIVLILLGLFWPLLGGLVLAVAMGLSAYWAELLIIGAAFIVVAVWNVNRA